VPFRIPNGAEFTSTDIVNGDIYLYQGL